MPFTGQHAALLRGTIDIGLLRIQTAPAELAGVPVMEDLFLLAVPSSHCSASLPGRTCAASSTSLS